MAFIKEIQTPDNTKHQIKNTIIPVIGTQTATTGAWTGNIDLPELYDGLTISYFLPWAPSGNASLNLTLNDGTTTGAINCYYNYNRLTTHFAKGSNIIMTYYSAGSISIDGVATTDNRWIAQADYTSDSTGYYLRRIYPNLKAGTNKIFPFTMIMQNADGRWESIVTSSTVNSTKTRNTHGFRLGQVLLMYANATYNADALVGTYNIWTMHSGLIDHRYSFNTENNATKGTTGYKPVYLVGIINNNDGLFYLDETWWTQTLPSTDNGKVYIYIGDAYDYYRMTFVDTQKFYKYTNGALREISQDTVTVNGHAVNKDVPSNAIFTDTTYSAGNGLTLTGTSFNVGKRWSAVSQGQKWSRLYAATPVVSTVGTSGILSLGATRGSVVYNVTFLVTSSHASTNYVHITQIDGNNYTTIRVRGVAKSNGEYYFEIYDTAQGIASGTTQSWNCCFIPLADTTLTTYTTFTDGSTIPSGYSAFNDFTTTQYNNASAIKNISRSGTTFTATKQDGSTFTFDQQGDYLKLSGGTLTGNLVTTTTRIANTYYGISFGRTNATPVETILYTGIEWVSGSHMPVIHITGYAYGLYSPVEFKIGFYIFNNKIGYCGVTNMGAWKPTVYLFKYTSDSVDYVAVGLAGSCYFLQLQVDVQDEIGKFAHIVTDSSKWTWSFLTSTGTIPAVDDGTTCCNVPYKADILKDQYHTTGSWSGLTYTATNNGGVGNLAFTIPTGTTSSTVAIGNHNHDDAYLKLSGGTLTGNFYVSGATEKRISLKNPINNSLEVYMANPTNGKHGLFSTGYLNGTTYTQNEKWLVKRDSDGKVYFNGFTIESSVPSDAVFTDTTYTFTNGTNGFTVTPSGGAAQTVIVTPSIANNITGSGTNGKIAKFTGTNTIGNGYGVDTTVTSGSDNLITSGAVYTAIADLPEPMVFKGSLGTGGTITTLPVDGSAKVGDTYKVITDGTYSGQAAKIGDLFICDSKTSSANTWTYIPSADEPSGTVTSITIKATSPIAINSSSAITTSGTRTISHADSGVSAGTYKSVTVNATGHITSGTNPTTLSGYGITDAKISNGTITLGSNTITPLTSHETETQIRSYLTSTVGHVCKNLLPITLESGTYTDGGANLTYTVDKTAGTITINGTSRTNDNDPITLHIFDDSTSSLNGKLYFSGGSEHCPVRAYDGTTRAWAKAWNGVDNSPYSYSENQSSELAPVSGHETQYRIRIAANQTIVNEVVKPMLRDGSISDDTFEPYVTPTDERIAPMIYSPINHNGIYRGKDLTNVYTIDEIHNRVQNGSFDDLYLGDYFTVSITTDIYTKFTGAAFVEGTTYYTRTGTLNNRVYTETEDTSYDSSKTYYTKTTVTEDVSLMIAHFNYYSNARFAYPHIILTNRNYGFVTTSKMDPTNTTVGGYYNSEMHQTTLPCYAKSLKTALNNYLVYHDSLLTNVVDVDIPSMAGAGIVGASTESIWGYSTALQLMTEQQLAGSSIWTSSALDVGCDGNKLAVFNFINPGQYERGAFWLRTIVSKSHFAIYDTYGYGNKEWIDCQGADFSAHVRPLIVFG